MEIIRIYPEGVLQLIPFPKSTISGETHFLQNLIGKNCTFEHVRPKRLYSELGVDRNVSMLVDEDGLYKELPLNPIGSWLYETDIHGHPIVGTILIVGEEDTDDGIDFCGLPQEVINIFLSKFFNTKKREERKQND